MNVLCNPEILFSNTLHFSDHASSKSCIQVCPRLSRCQQLDIIDGKHRTTVLVPNLRERTQKLINKSTHTSTHIERCMPTTYIISRPMLRQRPVAKQIPEYLQKPLVRQLPTVVVYRHCLGMSSNPRHNVLMRGVHCLPAHIPNTCAKHTWNALEGKLCGFLGRHKHAIKCQHTPPHSSKHMPLSTAAARLWNRVGARGGRARGRCPRRSSDCQTPGERA